jgi:hypothetical protein
VNVKKRLNTFVQHSQKMKQSKRARQGRGSERFVKVKRMSDKEYPKDELPLKKRGSSEEKVTTLI